MIDNSPYFNKLNRDRLEVRQVDELIGLAKGLVADGKIVDAELQFLVRWLVANREIVRDPLVSGLYRRVQAMLSDGVFTDEERGELLTILQHFGSRPMEDGEPMLASELPFSTPLPEMEFTGWRYCFTGTFVFGTRERCEAEVAARGAVSGSLTKNTDALVVGHYATESWLHSPYGRKIMKAVEMRQAGHPIVIVPEAHWSASLA